MSTLTPDTLIRRCLHEVFGERDPVKRRAAIAVLCTTDCVFIDHDGVRNGREGLDAAAAAVQARLPEHVFAELGPCEVVHSMSRQAWTYGRPGDPRPIRGLDIVLTRDGQITHLLTFIDDSAGHTVG